MKKIGTRLPVSFIEDHKYICDLINIEGPLLSLYKAKRKNWLYFWADIEEKTNRWVIFYVKRNELADYLKKVINLRDLIGRAENLYCLDVEQKELAEGEINHSYGRMLSVINKNTDVAEYMPSEESYFSEEFTGDISISAEVTPTVFSIPIDKEWFISDLDKFSRAYSGLYAFLYCTGDRFFNNVGDQVRFHLSAPWQGGFSRVNLFGGLIKSIPSLHDMQIKKISYASPGSIDIEALSTVGDEISKILTNFITGKDEINVKVKFINEYFNQRKLKKRDLSKFDDKAINLMDIDVAKISSASSFIAKKMAVENEFEYITKYSPNSIVAAKALLALVSQVGKLVEYEEAGMIGISHKTETSTSLSSTPDLFREN